METQHDRSHLLRDLALIYLTLAHGTDEDLDDAEVDAIAEVLGDWQDEAGQETALSAIKGALALYERDDALEQVNAAISNVRDEVPDEQREQVLDDMVEIAMADGRFLHEESSFIGELAEAWDVSISEYEDWAGQAWSVLRTAGPGEQWTPLHDLSLIYLTLAYETDRDLDAREVDAIAEKISEWVPGTTAGDVQPIVREVLDTCVQGPDERLIADSIEAVGEAVPAHQQGALLDDLRYVALADGKLLAEEKQMIDRLAKAWSVELEPMDPQEQ